MGKTVVMQFLPLGSAGRDTDCYHAVCLSGLSITVINFKKSREFDKTRCDISIYFPLCIHLQHSPWLNS